jgi:hypothetical protein
LESGHNPGQIAIRGQDFRIPNASLDFGQKAGIEDLLSLRRRLRLARAIIAIHSYPPAPHPVNLLAE